MIVENTLLIADLCDEANVLLYELVNTNQDTDYDHYKNLSRTIRNIHDTIKAINMADIGKTVRNRSAKEIFEAYDKTTKVEKIANYKKMKAMGM